MFTLIHFFTTGRLDVYTSIGLGVYRGTSLSAQLGMVFAIAILIPLFNVFIIYLLVVL